jgi:lipopolysaccharide transport system ATP-binding protein
MLVDVAISTMAPVTIHVHERDAVAFQVIDSIDGDSSRGRDAGLMPGIVRPMLEWKTRIT